MTTHVSLDLNSGTAGSALRIAREYESCGHDVRVISFDDLPSRLSWRQRIALFPLFVARRLASADREGVDVVDCHTGDGWLWSLGRRRDTRPVFVTRSHGIEHLVVKDAREAAARGELKLSWKFPLYFGGLHLKEVTTSLRRADLILFLNTYERDYAVEKLGIDPGRAFVSHNALPPELVGLRIAPTPRSNEPVGIAQIGMYLPHKGIGYGQPALSDVLTRRPETRVTFLGTAVGPDRVLADFDPELHPRIRVIERFEHSELPALLAGCHIKFFPTLFEGFGKALLEGMACGLAPITTDVHGPRDFVRDGVTGLVVPPRDVQALIGSLFRLIDDRVLLHRIRFAAYRAAQPFTWRRMADQRLALYDEALRRTRRAA